MDTRTLLLTLALSACSLTSVPTKPYVPVVVHHELSREAVVERIVQLAETRGWSVVASDPLRGSVTAVASTVRRDVEERQTWVFSVTDSALRVSRFEALRFLGGAWETSSGVCLSYAYAEESEVLRDVLITERR